MTKIQDFTNEDLEDKVVLLRTDFNVPTKNNKITDHTRITESIPTIKALIKKKATILIITHRGRPNGQVDKKLSMLPVAEAVSKIIKKPIKLINQIGQKLNPDPTNIYMLENIRFFSEEEENQNNFSKILSNMGDIYINDAFSVSHRLHASICGIPKYIPSFVGLSMAKEINALNDTLDSPKKPLLAIVGGSKVSTKISIIENLLYNVNTLVIGGAMANTFLHAIDKNIGKSLFEKKGLDIAINIIKKAKEKNVKIILPIDAKVAERIEPNVTVKNKVINHIQEQDMILDLGIESTNIILKEISNVKTVIWNGPLGAIEHRPFDQSTIEIAKFIAQRCKKEEINAIAGGGDTVHGINLANSCRDFTHVSTAGGAFLEWLEGKKLPGVVALENN
tara:strand:- start:20167 stop:21345 length:1179 start_codon:yes stop_codon:yes gene_type:complete